MDSVASVIDSASRIPAEIAFLVVAAVLGTGFSLMRGKGRAVSLIYALLIGTSFHMVARQSLAGHGVMTMGLASVGLYAAAVMASYFLIERFIHGEFSFSGPKKIIQTCVMGIGFASSAAYAFLVVPGLGDIFNFTGTLLNLDGTDAILVFFSAAIAAPSVARAI